MKPDAHSDRRCSALVLAGSRPGETDAVARSIGVPCKALAPAAGRSMVERVVSALRAHPDIADIHLSLPDRLPLSSAAPDLARWIETGAVERIDPHESPVRSVAARLAHLPANTSVLVTTADHALLSTAMVDEFLDLAERTNHGADIVVGMVPLALLREKYPALRRTRLRFRNGDYKACNLFLVRNGPGAQAVLRFWLALESQRKAPLKMAWHIGPTFLLRYALRLLTLRQALSRLSARTGARIAPVFLTTPEAAIDVDKPADLIFVDKLLRRT